MRKVLISVNLLFLLFACTLEKPIRYSSYHALSCKENSNQFKEYIFNRNNGHLYFYSKKKNKFIPLNLRLESGFYSEDLIEVFSYIENNKLIIIAVEYIESQKGFLKYRSAINLNTLVKKTSYKNNEDKLISSKVRCNWIDPMSSKSLE